jgi:hypothetical protein
MFAFSIAAMLAGSAMLPNYSLPPAKTAARTKCAKACARRYRLPSADDAADGSKYRALGEDGTDCNVTRAKICRNAPPTLVRTTY